MPPSRLIFAMSCLVVGGLIGTGGFLFSRSATGSPSLTQDPAGFIPAGVCALVEYRGDQAPALAGRLGLAELLEDEDLRPFAASLKKLIDSLGARVLDAASSALGLGHEDLKLLARSRVLLAFLDAKDFQRAELLLARVVLWMEFARDLEGARRFLEILEKLVLKWGEGSFQDRVVAGVTVREYVPPENSPLRAWYCVRGSEIWLATRMEDLERILVRIKSGDTRESLATEPSWQATAQEGAAPALLARAWAHVPRMLSGWVEPGSEEASVLEQAGVGSVRSVAVTVSVEGRSVREKVVFDVPEKGPGMLSLEKAARPLEGPRLLPRDTSWILGSRIQLDTLIDVGRRVLASIGQEHLLDQAIGDLSGMIGADFEADVIPLLAGEMGVGQVFPRSAVIPDTWVWIEVKDPVRASDQFRRWLERQRPQAPVTTVWEAGIEIHTLEPARMRDGERIDASSIAASNLRLSWAVIEPYLVVAPWPAALRHLVRSSAEDGPHLVDREEFAKGGIEGPGCLRFWADLPSAAAFLVDNATPLLQWMELPEPFAAIDPLFLPEGDQLARHLEPLEVGLRVEPAGLAIEVRSPCGILPFLFL